MKNLHNAIMKLVPATRLRRSHSDDYWFGLRDGYDEARHAASELVAAREEAQPLPAERAGLYAQECCQAHGGAGSHPPQCDACPRKAADMLAAAAQEIARLQEAELVQRQAWLNAEAELAALKQQESLELLGGVWSKDRFLPAGTKLCLAAGVPAEATPEDMQIYNGIASNYFSGVRQMAAGFASDAELQRHNDYVAGFDEGTKRAQQVAVPPTICGVQYPGAESEAHHSRQAAPSQEPTDAEIIQVLMTHSRGWENPAGPYSNEVVAFARAVLALKVKP